MKLRRFLSAVFVVLSFLLVFEAIARLSAHLRQVTQLFPLSENGFSKLSVLTDEHGTRSSIYRGQAQRWAVFGTSYTQGNGITQSRVWTNHLERLYRGKVHIKNYSHPGSFELQQALLRTAVRRKERYDKVIISVAQITYTLSKPRPLAQLLPETGKFLSAPPYRAWQSGEILTQILSPAIETLRFRARSFRLGDLAFGDSSLDSHDYIDFETYPDFEACYIAQMNRRKCAGQFRTALTSGMSNAQAWALYESKFLTCQATVDARCGIAKRLDGFHPNYVGHATQYRHQLELLIKEARKLSDNIYLISRVLGTDESALPYTLATDFGTSLYTAKTGMKLVALSTKAGAAMEELRNQENTDAVLSIITQQPDLKFLDFATWFKTQRASANHPKNPYREIALFPAVYFTDFAHLSEQGNQVMAEFVFREIQEKTP